VPRQFSHTEGQSMSSHPTLLISAFGGMSFKLVIDGGVLNLRCDFKSSLNFENSGRSHFLGRTL
jgi:hypothetical protein